MRSQNLVARAARTICAEAVNSFTGIALLDEDRVRGLKNLDIGHFQ